MPDVYARITEIDSKTQERLIDVLEMRANDPQQLGMWEAYLSSIEFPPSAPVLEIGCGTGAISRILAQRLGSREYLASTPPQLSLTGPVSWGRACQTFPLSKATAAP